MWLSIRQDIWSWPTAIVNVALYAIVAQWMMTRKKLENWLGWSAVDVLYVGMFIHKGLYLTSALYAVFLALAVRGYGEWRHSMTVAFAAARAAT